VSSKSAVLAMTSITGFFYFVLVYIVFILIFLFFNSEKKLIAVEREFAKALGINLEFTFSGDVQVVVFYF
jgi:ABC-type Fe3+-siderophore transport system permease subunit